MRIKIFCIALFLLIALMPQILHSQTDWSDAEGLQYYFSQGSKFAPGYDQRHDWKPWALSAIAICILANSLVYVLGRTFSMPDVERFAVSEFYHVSASAIMIFVLVLSADSMFGVVELALPQGTTTLCAGYDLDVWSAGPIGIVQCKIEEKILYLEALYDKAYYNNKQIEWLTTSCIYFMSYPVYCFDWNMELHAEMEKSHYIANRIAPLAINLHGQYMFMDYIAKNMLAVFLPIGLLLRIAPVFRGVGGLFIALALAFYFVFPIAYVMLDPTTVRPDPSSIIAPVPFERPDACFNTFSGFVDMITKPPQFQQGAAGESSDPNNVGAELARMQMESFFYPLVALAAAILFVSSIAPLLGGDSGYIMHFLTKVI